MINYLQKLTNYITKLTAAVLVIMMAIITIGVLTRIIEKPLLGTVELVELTMTLLIAVSLPFAHSQDAHIKVDILYKVFPNTLKTVLAVISNILSLVVTGIVSIVFIKLVLTNLSINSKTTDLLLIPLLPFKLIIAIGFTAWFIYTIIDLFKFRREVK